jgi:hypothetical protein
MAASRIGLRLVSLTASTPAELRALAPAALSGSDGLLVMPDAMFWNNRATIIGVASKAGVPAVYPEREYADDGGLIAYVSFLHCIVRCWQILLQKSQIARL